MGQSQKIKLYRANWEILGMMSGGETGIRTLGTLLTYTRFPSVRLKPLGHLSGTGLVIPTLAKQARGNFPPPCFLWLTRSPTGLGYEGGYSLRAFNARRTFNTRRNINRRCTRLRNGVRYISRVKATSEHPCKVWLPARQ